MKLRYVLGLSLLAATVAFTSCKKDEKKDNNTEQNQNKAVTLDDIAGLYMAEGGNMLNVAKEGDKLKFMAGASLDNLMFTLGETKDGVTTLKGETSTTIEKAEGKFTAKDKKLVITVKEKDKDEQTTTWTKQEGSVQM